MKKEDVAYEQALKKQFPYKNISAEEFAARNSHTIGCFSLHKYSFPDEEFDRWLKQLGDILSSFEKVKEVRKKYLSEEKINEIEGLSIDL